ncbi:hypothetical protein [Streptomyces mayteni]
MDATTSSLVVAVVGVLGTLLSGLLAHRGALRSKAIELDHLAVERREERAAQERRELLERRRASYAAFNQALRQCHLVLGRHHDALRAGPGHPLPSPEVEVARDALRHAYADAQMAASDAVLKVGGDVFFQLSKIHGLLTERSAVNAPAELRLDDAERLLKRASAGLYAVRQTMRNDLGITDLPIERPEDHGTVR